MNKLVLIDGNSLINRGFYATPPLSTSSGTPVNAVYAFINMLIKIIGDISPTHILVAFDRKEPTFRHLMYNEYKGTRKPMPDDLRPQIDVLKEVLDAMHIARYEQAGIEADDIIGAVAKKFTFETIIITGDKDSLQLVDNTTKVYFTKKGISELEVYSMDNFVDKTGIEPFQIIEMKALMGDASDNIPGVAGIGSVTALKLLQKYTTIENIYEHLEELTGRTKEKIRDSRDLAFLSKKLATIDVGLDIPVSIDDLRYEYPFKEETKNIFVKYEFRNLLKKTEIFDIKKDVLKAPDTAIELVQIKDKSDFTPLVKSEKIAVVINKNINIYNAGREFEIGIKQGFFGEGMMYDDAMRLLKEYFEDSSCHLIVYAKKDFMYELDGFGIKLAAYTDDVSLEKYVLDSVASLSLEDFLLTNGVENNPAYFLYLKHEEYLDRLKEEGTENLYKDIELPLVDVLFDMEKCGFKIDRKMLSVLSEQFEARISDLHKRITEIIGYEININSPAQLGDVLFNKLGLKAGKKNQRGYSTSADVLEELEDSHEIIPLILEYRKIAKLNSTYIDGFKRLVDVNTDFVHTTFYQTMTSTGRLSSREPNLQNVPVRDEGGKELRKLFVSSFENGKIVGADYSQIELRLLAHFSKSEKLLAAYNNNIDIHSMTASQVFGVPLDKVTSEMRRTAKVVNFGIIYGISDFGLAKQLKISVKNASEYIDRYFQNYGGVKEYMDGNVDFAKSNGYVKTIFGRRRYIREVNSSNYNTRTFGERAAMNMPLQGTAADIIKLAMLKVYKRLKSEKLKSKMILQVHDELLIDTAPDEVETVRDILVEEMESAVSLNVPLKAEAECGTRWYDAK